MNRSVLIADDEPLSRLALREHLVALGWDGPILESSDGRTAIAVANRERPDVLFLDIVMPGATGLQVLGELAYEPKVVFTTAHDRYAVTAFELGALDYLLKPFGRERLAQVLSRIQTASRSAVPLLSRAQESLGTTALRSRIFVRDGPRIVPIPLVNLERVQGADDYVTLHTPAKQYLVSVRMSEIEQQLATANFMRVHRSHLINLDYIVAIERYNSGRVLVIMKSGTRIIASRAGSRRLRDLAL